MNIEYFKHVIDIAGITYLLMIIAFLLVYIAIKVSDKDSSPHKKSSHSTSHRINK
jgi:hypothetical protein